ncbi:MAG: hypothetical protein AB1758_15280, partial [Candidatus Eremiobacterota bacterium]
MSLSDLFPSANPLEWFGPIFIWLYVPAVVFTFFMANTLYNRARGHGVALEFEGAVDPYAAAYLAGGARRAA